MGAIVRDGLKFNDVSCMLLHCIVLKGARRLFIVCRICLPTRVHAVCPYTGFRYRLCERIKGIDAQTGGGRYIVESCRRRQWVNIIVPFLFDL